jgi:hypothetical protein
LACNHINLVVGGKSQNYGTITNNGVSSAIDRDYPSTVREGHYLTVQFPFRRALIAHDIHSARVIHRDSKGRPNQRDKRCRWTVGCDLSVADYCDPSGTSLGNKKPSAKISPHSRWSVEARISGIGIGPSITPSTASRDIS